MFLTGTSCNNLYVMSFNICSTPVIMLALMIPGLIILLVDHHNRVEEEALFAEMKRNPNMTLPRKHGSVQGVGLMDLIKHDHHKDHDHDEAAKAKTP